VSAPRVLMITPDFPPQRGGIQLLAHRIAAHLRESTVRVLTLGHAEAGPWDRREGLDVVRVAGEGSHRADVARLNAAALREARRFGPDVVLCMHICVAPAATAIRQAFRVPVLTYMYAREVAASRRLAELSVRISDRVVAISRYTARIAEDLGARRVSLITPGVDAEPATSGSTQRLQRPTVLTVSRMTERYKGHDVMIRALPLIRTHVPDVQWAVVGDGALRGSLQRLAEANGVADAVLMRGAVDDAERDRWLDTAHVFAMPSRVPAGDRAGEGFGIVYLEAGVHGLPVVAGAGGGALDAVLDGRTGRLVDPSDHVAVAGAISDLLTEPAAAARMGEAGREHAREFAWPRIADRLQELITESAGRG